MARELLLGYFLWSIKIRLTIKCEGKYERVYTYDVNALRLSRIQFWLKLLVLFAGFKIDSSSRRLPLLFIDVLPIA